MEDQLSIASQFVPYELAVKLKELGFDEPCFARFRRGIFQLNVLGKPYKYNSNEVVEGDKSAPLWQQAFSFISSKVNFEIDDNNSYALTFDGEFSLELRQYFPYEGYSICEIDTSNCDTLKKLIELCK